MDAYHRRFNLIKHGVDEHRGENCVVMVSDIRAKRKGINNVKVGFDRTDPVGRKGISPKSRPQPFIVRFTRHPCADHLYSRQSSLIYIGIWNAKGYPE